MSLRIPAYLLIPLSILLAGTAPVLAAERDHDHDHDHDEHHQHEAHVHGEGRLNIVRHDKELHIELISPAANIVGFEHAPTSEAEHAKLDAALARLKDGASLFGLPTAAGCKVHEARVSTPLAEEAQHDDHGHDKHDHNEHDHDKHDHDKHDEDGETHADITAEYHIECAQPAALSQLRVELFEAFPSFHHIEAQIVGGDRQRAVELTPAGHVIDF